MRRDVRFGDYYVGMKREAVINTELEFDKEERNEGIEIVDSTSFDCMKASASAAKT